MMKRALYVLVIVIFPFLLSSCAPVFGKYYYFSLEGGDGVVVLERSASDVSNLFFHDEMPTKYQVMRNEYSIFIEIDKKSYLPVISMNALSDDGANYVLKEQKTKITQDCISFSQFTKETENHIKFFWYSCNEEDAPEAVTVYFDVFNQDEVAVSSEELRFKLTPNGIHYFIDAL